MIELLIMGMTLMPPHYTIPYGIQTPQVVVVPPVEYEMMAKVTAYTTAKDECGKNDGITANGERAIPNGTIAVDPRIIPLGSMVYIPTRGWLRANDTGGAIKTHNGITRIDLCVGSKKEAFNWGVRHLKVKWRPPNTEWEFKVVYPKFREHRALRWMSYKHPTLTL